MASFVEENQVGNIVTQHGGGEVFAFQMPDDSLEPICAAGGLLVFDARVDINNGDFVGLLYKGIPMIRKIFLNDTSLFLQTASGQDSPELIDRNYIKICFKIVECIKKM